MQQAILITAYKNLRHLLDIVNFFKGNNFSFFIHIDKKTVLHPSQVEMLENAENVRLVTNEYTVNWGGVNHLKAILLLLKEVVENENPDYIHLITGHDFPIKTPDFFNDFLSRHKGSEYMEVNKFPYQSWKNGGYDRILLYNANDLIDGRKGWGKFLTDSVLKVQELTGMERKLPVGFPDLYGGSTYWSITGEFGTHVLNFIKNNPFFLQAFDYTFCAEEIFFQTILMDSPFKNNLVNNNLRHICWETRNGNYPANLDLSDYDAITESDALFARKFEYPGSADLLKKIKDDLIRNDG